MPPLVKNALSLLVFWAMPGDCCCERWGPADISGISERKEKENFSSFCSPELDIQGGGILS